MGNREKENQWTQCQENRQNYEEIFKPNITSSADISKSPVTFSTSFQ